MEKYRKTILFALALALTGILAIPVHAQSTEPRIKLKTKDITVCAETQMQVTEIINRITITDKEIEEFRITPDKPGIRAKIDKKRALDSMLYMDRKGTYKLTITVTDRKLRQMSKTVRVKVLKPIKEYIHDIPMLKIKKGTKLTYARIMNRMAWDNRRITGVYIDKHNINTKKKGNYYIRYEMTGKHQTYSTKDAVRKVIVY